MTTVRHTVSTVTGEERTGRLSAMIDEPAATGSDLTALREALARLWGGRWFVARATLAAMLVAGVVALLLPNQYTSTATLLPSGGKGMMGSLAAGLGGQLADLGLASAIQGADPSESSELFPNVLRSRTIGDAVIAHTYTGTAGELPEPFDLYHYFDQMNPDYAFQELQRVINVGQDPRTGIISVAATTPYPKLSQQIAAALLAELERYNRERRKTQGTEKVAFLETRLADVRTELAASEDALRQFRAQNMNYVGTADPDLLAELGRLEREEMIKSELYGMLTQQYEMAKVEAADQTPIIQVLDEPMVPQVKSAPSRKGMVMMAALMAALAAGLMVLGIGPLLVLFPQSRWLNRLAMHIPRPFPWPFARLRLGRGGEARR